MAVDFKKLCVSFFKLHGFTLHNQALTTLINDSPDDRHEEWLEKLMEVIQQQPLESPVITLDILQNVLQNCEKFDTSNTDTLLTVIDAFTVPKFNYKPDKKKMEEYEGPPLKLNGDGNVKAELFRNRYILLQQRTARHELFLPPIPGAPVDPSKSKFQLKSVEYLLASTARLGDILVLGMLTQLKEGKYFIEDLTGAVQLDLSATKFHVGLITENCFVLAEGTYDDGVFHVNAMGFPPAETACTTRAYFGNKNFFGGESNTCGKVSSHLRNLEERNQDAMFVIVSDVWLNETKVIEKLKVLFDGFSESPPTCFILIGNFLSSYAGLQDSNSITRGLKTLADIISDFPSILKSSKFILVPGPKDPGLSNILPRPQIPKCLTKEFSKRIPNAVFGTNPCRIQYFTQEIVVLREDIVTKMCRNAIYFPKEDNIPTHFVKTLISQAHLCPLPLHITPVYWAYDHVLHLYPLPDLIICADRYDSFCVKNMDCLISNPGSFPRNEFNFQVYMPATKEVESSQIPEEIS